MERRSHNNIVLGLNLGCGPLMLKTIDEVDFINIDHDKMYQEYADKQGADFTQLDLAKERLPNSWSKGPVVFINMSQFLEHLNLPDVINLLDDCFTVLENGGKIRISVPDTELLLFHLKTNKMDKFVKVQPAKWYEKFNSQMMKFSLLLFGSLHEDGESGHKMCYDFNSLKELLESIGFAKIRRVEFDNRYDAEVGENHQLCVEAIKP
jgi:predicted SAM-dependent methyltransferase